MANETLEVKEKSLNFLEEIIEESMAKGEKLPCKTLLIAAGLIPERELVTRLGNPEWLHICGNCRTVHPMVEAVVNEGKQAGSPALKHMR